ncbi:MAG TPA: glycosyltransferase [Pyrinomonadaceae bacterium]|nr:glycosyltransferase [Pyrinomonadaceae bacterium]
MRVLYFAPKEPWPTTTGALVRNYYLARELARTASVTYLAFTDDTNLPVNGDSAISQEGVAELKPEVDPMAWCEDLFFVRRESDYTLAKLVRGAVGRVPVTVLNYTTHAMRQELGRILNSQDFDVVQVESIHLALYLPIIRSARSRPLTVCDWHNIESDLMRQYSDHIGNRWRRLYARRAARQLSAIERQAAQGFDVHITVTEADRERLFEFAPNARAHVIPNGVDGSYYSDELIEQAHASWLETKENASINPTARRRVLFVGSMDYHANVDAVVEFAHSVWPRMQAQMPDLIFTIVGRNPPPEVRQLAALPAIEVTGTVKDVRPYYREALAALVPLRVGGGSRLKILEAMAAGVPVISTRRGAEGIEVKEGENILFAETGDEFCRRLAQISESETQWRRLSASGRVLAREKYDWAKLGDELAKLYGELLSNRRSSHVGGVTIARKR